MSSVKEKPMKRKLFGSSEQDERTDSNTATGEKKRRRKNAVETPKHYPKSERQQLALVLQMTSMGNSPEPVSPPPTATRKTPGGSGRKDKIHKRNERGETALHLCTIRGDLDAMKELIRQGADVNVQDFAGWTPLHEACNHGHQEITQYLLEVGANVNSKGLEDDTPLHDAVTNSHRDLVELLLKHGANPLLKNKRGKNPLDIAEDQTIRELMQKEVIPSDDESESELDCVSPSRSEDSLESHKNAGKIRTTSVSSSNQECVKKRKKHKLKAILEKPKSFSPLTSDSTSESDDSSDNVPLIKKKHVRETPRSNGYGDSAGAKSKKQKRKSEDDSGRKSQKTKDHAPKAGFADLLSSSDMSSDSDHRMQRKDKNGTLPRSNELKKHLLVNNEKGDYTKQKSLYPNEKMYFSEKKPIQVVDLLYKKKPMTQPDQTKRARSISSEESALTTKVKSKTLKSSEEKPKPAPGAITLKVNGFQHSAASPHRKKEEADGSVYDFSLSTEDFTDTSAISLKQKFKDKASELFDVLCLGRPSKSADSNTEAKETTSPKAQRRPSKDKTPIVKVSEKADTSSTSHHKEATLDKNHNRINESFEKTVKKSVPLPQTCNNPSYNHLPQNSTVKQSEIRTADFDNQPSGAKEMPVAEDPRVEKKVKKHRAPSTSPKKPPHDTVATAVIKSDNVVKKEFVKTELVDNRPEKQKKPSFEGEPKTPSADKITGGSGSVKKKKKHKHKHSHDTPSSEHKHRQRVVSVDNVIYEKDKSVSAQGKPLLKKSDSSKSLHGAVSRKISQEGRAESGVIATMRKKVRSTDSTGSETSVKSTKQSASVSKSIKSSASASLDKQSTPTTVKKDKAEVKKIALISDANSSFLSELEKSSRQREMEKKMKLKRKKKLLQQQRLKAQNAAEMAMKDAKQNTPTGEKAAPVFSDKTIYDSNGPMLLDGMKHQPMSVPAHGGIFLENLPSQLDPNYHFRNYGNHYPDHANSLDHPGFPQGIFKPPPLSGRSVSQVDDKGSYPQESTRTYPENWNHPERGPYVPHEKKHAPVQRSLSFSGQSPDVATSGRTPQGLLVFPDSKSGVYHEALQHRHSLTEVPHSRPTNFPESPVRTPQLHPANGPVPSVKHLPNVDTASFVSRMPSVPATQSSFSPTIAEGKVNPPLVTSDTQNPNNHVPTKGSSIPASTTNTTHSAGNVSDQIKPNSVTDSKPKEGDSSTEVVEGENNSVNDRKPNVESKEASSDENPSAEEKKSETPESSVNKEEMERKIALENYVKERLSKLEAVIEEPKPKRLPVFIPMEKLKKTAEKDPMQDRLNVYEEWAVIQKQINERRKKYYAAVVIPQPPRCYYEYMTYTGAYLLSGSRESWLSVPVLAPPPSLGEDMHALFVEHENERVKLRLQHATQREKLIVACEQEIMRVHSRAARMLQNQQIPLSACSILLDREIYNLERRNKKAPDENNGRTASIRDRFNGRMHLSWLQDVNDKYVKMKSVLLARQRHESQALHAVQRTEWFLKLQEVENQGQQKKWTHSKPEDVSDLYVPLVNISDDFDLLPG